MPTAESSPDRRAFVAAALTSLAALAVYDDGTAQEVPPFRADVPPGATLWDFAVLTADEPMELTVAAGKAVQAVRG